MGLIDERNYLIARLDEVSSGLEGGSFGFLLARNLSMAVEGLDSRSEGEERPRDLNTGNERKTRRHHEESRSSTT